MHHLGIWIWNVIRLLRGVSQLGHKIRSITFELLSIARFRVWIHEILIRSGSKLCRRRRMVTKTPVLQSCLGARLIGAKRCFTVGVLASPTVFVPRLEGHIGSIVLRIITPRSLAIEHRQVDRNPVDGDVRIVDRIVGEVRICKPLQTGRSNVVIRSSPTHRIAIARIQNRIDSSLIIKRLIRECRRSNIRAVDPGVWRQVVVTPAIVRSPLTSILRIQNRCGLEVRLPVTLICNRVGHRNIDTDSIGETGSPRWIVSGWGRRLGCTYDSHG